MHLRLQTLIIHRNIILILVVFIFYLISHLSSINGKIYTFNSQYRVGKIDFEIF